MIADIISNKKLNQIVLFVRWRKLNISTVYITQTYFPVPKGVRINCTHFVIMEIPNKQELQQIVISHSSDINSKDFMNLFKKCIAKPYILAIDTTLT